MAFDPRQIHDKHLRDASHADPANWRGLFYYNKSDRRIFPPKRNPAMGWTVNWANPRSVTAFILLLAFALALTALIAYLAGSD
jgi:uncharacterized membrane protein